MDLFRYPILVHLNHFLASVGIITILAKEVAWQYPVSLHCCLP